MKLIYTVACTFALAVCSAAAQDADAAKRQAELQADTVKMQVEAQYKAQLDEALKKVKLIGMEGGIMSNVKGAPYSAEQITESTQILSDGTRIHNESAVKIYRDGQGRMRRETPEMITIFDPIAGEGYNLDPVNLTAAKIHVAVKQGPNSVSWSSTAAVPDGKSVQVYTSTKTAVGEGSGSGAGAGGRGGFVFNTIGPNLDVAVTKSGARGGKRDDLGTQNMEGVNAQGTRNTHMIEAGEIGNDRPIQVVDERWYSPDLQLDVMNKHTDPRTGEQTTRLVNIQRGEPDPSLFQLPAAYTVNEPEAVRKMKLNPLGKD
jgi:hypothetical protein